MGNTIIFVQLPPGIQKRILNANADCMSRLPLPTCSPVSEATNHIRMIELSTSPVTFEDVQMHSKEDAIIARVIDFVLTRERYPENGEPFCNRIRCGM